MNIDWGCFRAVRRENFNIFYKILPSEGFLGGSSVNRTLFADDVDGFCCFCSPLVVSGRAIVGGVALGAVGVFVSISVMSGSLLAVVERVGLNGLGDRMGGVVVGNGDVWGVVLGNYGSIEGAAVVSGPSIAKFSVSGGGTMSCGCSIGISSGGAGSASGMFGETVSKTKSGLLDVLTRARPMMLPLVANVARLMGRIVCIDIIFVPVSTALVTFARPAVKCGGRFVFQEHDFLRRWEGRIENMERSLFADDVDGFCCFCSPLVVSGRAIVGGVALGAVDVCVSISVMSGSLLAVVERVGLNGLGNRMGGVVVGMCGTFVVLGNYGSIEGAAVVSGPSIAKFSVSGGGTMSCGCSIGISSGGAGSASGMFGKTCPKQIGSS
nr:hypothetical protein [Tanacetum cinerariifolium]